MSKKYLVLSGDTIPQAICEPTADTTPEPVKIPFAVWFDAKVKEGKLRKHQGLALATYFDKHGLQEIDTLDSYESWFKKF